MKTKRLLITCAATLLCLPACATKREVPFRASPGAPFTDKMARYDYSTYDKIPVTPTSAVYRAVLKAFPYTRGKAFHGKWAGNGCCGGRPVDAVDEIFRRHDIAYAEARTLRTMQLADDATIEALKKLDPRCLSPEALEFRERSVSFFSKRALTLVGKPVSVLWRFRESPDCPVRTKADMQALFAMKPETKAAPRAAAAAPSMLAARKPQRHAAPDERIAKIRPPALVRKPLLARLGAFAERAPLP